jgi:adenylate cyclase
MQGVAIDERRRPRQRAALPACGGTVRTVSPLFLSMDDLTLSEVARRIEVSPDTLRRWVREDIVPLDNGTWTPAAVAHARLVARLRARGHSLENLKEASRSGRLAYGYVEDLFPSAERTLTLEEAADEVGLEPALVERLWSATGLSAASLDEIGDEDLELLRHMATVLDAGFPLVAFLQLARVYGTAVSQIADAEVKLFHLYVHEPLIRDGRAGLEIAETMSDLVADVLPLATPIMERLHERALKHFMEQDVVGHLEAEAGDAELGRVRVTIAFADLAGYTRLTEEAGDEEAVDVVDRFVAAVQDTLPGDARVIKTIGDAVMVVGSDASSLVDWAVGFQALQGDTRPAPRIGLHSGPALYRDGDYYGRAVNLAARVGARAAGGEVLCTDPVRSAAGPHLKFQPIGEVKLKGFNEATELFLAAPSYQGQRT